MAIITTILIIPLFFSYYPHYLNINIPSISSFINVANIPFPIPFFLIKGVEAIHHVDKTVDSNWGETTPLRYKNETINRFMRWMIDNGAEFPSGALKLEVIPGYGLGIVTTSTLKKDDLYLKIPHSLMIGVNLIENDPEVGSVFKELNANYGQNPKYEIMFYLLHQKLVKGKDSFWSPYIDMLPVEFNNCPFFWGKELELLKGSTLYEKTLEERAKFEKIYENIRKRILLPYPKFFPASKITYREFIWAEWIFSSRVFYIEEIRPRENLVPLADFINCEEPDIVDHSLDFVKSKQNYLELRADRKFSNQSQIFESYGAKSNAESLKYEGFVNMKAPNDCIWINLPWKEQMKKFFRQSPPSCFSAKDLKRGKFLRSTLPYLRYYVLDDKERSKITIQNLSNKISNSNEKAALKLLKDIFLQYDKKNPFKESQLVNLEKRRKSMKESSYLGRLFRIYEKIQTKKLLQAIDLQLSRKFQEL